MPKLLAFSSVLLLALAAMAIVIYLLPSAKKEWILTKAAGIIPESLRERAEEFVLTPAEQRARIIEELEQRLEGIGENVSMGEAANIAREADALLSKLKSKNSELSLAEIAKTKLVETLLNPTVSGTSSVQCAP